MPIAPEEVEFVTYDESKVGVWGAFHGSREYTDGTASGAQQNATLHISHQILDTTIEKNAELFGKATTTFVSQVNGLRVVPFDLFGHLRIDKVTADTGEPLSFIQEDKKDDPNYFVILPKPLNLGDQYTVIASYGGLTQRLIYPKGPYTLHMIRMMMSDRRTGDQNFKETMQDFVKTYSGKAATTEDFKAMVEKHMTPEMKGFGGNMDWFLDEYVDGTAIPSYQFSYSFENSPEGDVVLAFKATQSNVDDHFRMLVPIYLELADGRTVNLGRARLTGKTTIDQNVPIKGLKEKPRRAMLNYMDDVLASN